MLFVVHVVSAYARLYVYAYVCERERGRKVKRESSCVDLVKCRDENDKWNKGKGEISSYSVAMQVLLERPTNGSVITLATRVRNENVGGAVAGWNCEQNDVVATREQMDDTKCAT